MKIRALSYWSLATIQAPFILIDKRRIIFVKFGYGFEFLRTPPCFESLAWQEASGGIGLSLKAKF